MMSHRSSRLTTLDDLPASALARIGQNVTPGELFDLVLARGPRPAYLEAIRARAMRAPSAFVQAAMMKAGLKTMVVSLGVGQAPKACIGADLTSEETREFFVPDPMGLQTATAFVSIDDPSNPPRLAVANTEEGRRYHPDSGGILHMLSAMTTSTFEIADPVSALFVFRRAARNFVQRYSAYGETEEHRRRIIEILQPRMIMLDKLLTMLPQIGPDR